VKPVRSFVMDFLPLARGSCQDLEVARLWLTLVPVPSLSLLAGVCGMGLAEEGGYHIPLMASQSDPEV